MSSQGTPAAGDKKGVWAALRRPSGRYSMLGLISVGFVAGVLFWGSFNASMEASNSMEFCISCHEMRQNIYEEYRKTAHYANPSGVRATCADCHVPRDWGHKLLRKVLSVRELYGKLAGTIDTKEKFEAKRLDMARIEWARMRASDSRECRNCHSYESMNLEGQQQRGRKQHELALRDGQTCIECHKGVAHKKPDGMTEEDAGA
jgi:cytochrome c-type protein NapC